MKLFNKNKAINLAMNAAFKLTMLSLALTLFAAEAAFKVIEVVTKP